MATPFTESWLLDYSREHVMHELSMLWETAESLSQHKEGSTEYIALLESFAIHLRNLIEFFFFSVKDEYVRAKHFFDDPATWSPEFTVEWKKLHGRASNEVTHLTTGRKSGNPAEKDWKIVDALAAIEPVARDFAANASAAKLDPKVREFLQQPADKMTVWIKNNVMHSNVAVPPPIMVIAGARVASTHTQIINKKEILVERDSSE